MSRKRPPALQIVPTTKPDLIIRSDYAEVAVSLLRYLAEHADDVYRFRGELAYVKRDDDGVPVIRKARPHDMRMLVRDHVQPVKMMGAQRREVSLPEDVAHLALATRNDLQDFRPIVAVTSTPLLRENGSIRLIDGYDEASAILCDFTLLPAFTLPERPTREEAEAALFAIRMIFRETPFADRICYPERSQETDLSLPPGFDESCFLMSLLTAICRPSMRTAPGVVIRAMTLSGGGSGKTTLAHSIAFTAFGAHPSDTPLGFDMAAFDKILGSTLRDGRAVALFDNGNRLTLQSNLLALLLTSDRAEDRQLGKSEMLNIASRALIIITGNSLSISEDLVRRLLAINLDPRLEDPERRPVSSRNFLNDVIVPQRAELLRYLLTIWRWGRLSRIPPGMPLASFDMFCRWVRDPLLALGCRDPVERIDELKAADPDRERVAGMFSTWWSVHGGDPVTAHELSSEVCAMIDPTYSMNNRKRVISTLVTLRGTRLAGFMLAHNADTKGGWSPTKYWLLCTTEYRGS